MAAPPAVRRRWPGKKIDLRKITRSPPLSRTAKMLRQRHSTRSFDDRRPITLSDVARFLDGAARAQSRFESRLGEGRPAPTYAVHHYSSGGGIYHLEPYLAVDKRGGLSQGL